MQQKFATGFIGLGNMGSAMALRLVAAGHQLVAFDRDTAAVGRLAAAGAHAASSVGQVGQRAEAVFLCLPSIEATRAVAAELAGTASFQVLVETSTVGPKAVRELAASLAKHGVDVVDAPVSGGPHGAEAGTLSVMHAGSPVAVQKVMPQLRSIAGPMFDVGTVPGLAQMCKLVNNAISAAGIMSACEAMVLGVKAGLDPDTLLAAVNAGSGRNSGTADKFPRAILPGTFDYGGQLSLMLKDLGLFIEQSRDHGVPSTMAPATLAAWQEAVRRTGADADYSMLIRHLEIDAGVEVRSRPRPTSMADRSGPP